MVFLLNSQTSSLFQFTQLNQKYVEQELKRLFLVSVDVLPTPLYNLQLVTEFLSDPALPFTPHNRSYAISCILSDLVTATYHQQRSLFILPPCREPITYPDALAAITQDAGIGSAELTGWSWLYYRFVRVELAIGTQCFCRLMVFDERTLRRHQSRAIGRLTMSLIKAEHQARMVAQNILL